MDSRTVQLLEFHKVLQYLASFAVSEAGQDACRGLAPFDDLRLIEERSALVREMLHYVSIHPMRLGVFPDVHGVFAFLANPLAFLDVDGLLGVWEFLQAMAAFADALGQPDEQRYPQLHQLAHELVLPPKTWSALRRCVSADGHLRDEASPELYSVRQEIRRIHQQCTRKVQDFFQNKDLRTMLQDEYLTISSDRYVLAVQTNFKGRLKGIVHDYSQTGETCYFEPLFLVELNNELQELRQEERVEEQKILRFVTGLIREEFDALHHVFTDLVRCDVLLALCHFAAHIRGQVIDVLADGPLRLTQARHPLLIFGADNVVPVDLVLEDEQRVLIITGGNAGGKTVCLKTLGLLGMMAHAAIPVPVDEGSTVPFWSNFVVSMGDEQSIEQSLSTFTAQIKHFCEVWPGLDAHTLVILDEFGVGTDPSQGAALAQAVVDSLIERQAWVGVATHFPALKAYGLSRAGVRAASVIFSPDTKKPLFKLGYDQVGASRALDVAREQGLPEIILSKAQEYLYLDSGDTEEIFERLNQLAVRKEQELDELGLRSVQLEQKYARKLEALHQERERMCAELRAASQTIMQEWREGRRGRKEALRELAALREDMAQARAEQTENVCPSIAPGDNVLYVPWQQRGTVLDLDERKNRMRVHVNGVTLWVACADVRPADQSERALSGVRSGVVVRREAGNGSSLRLDLRGLRTDEAEAELVRFLDKAVLAGHEQVEIIHGLGTGAMRKAVHSMLRESRAVSRFALASADEGGDGMTRVVLAD
ncbi:MAG: endonuclease MutS2 [Desulfovibrionales bacterium]|nr:endonuclease MutS2 [Desulfovibrionales bacterium]